MRILKTSVLIPSLLLVAMGTASIATAGKGGKLPKGGDGDGTITLMQLQDVHGHLVPLSAILENDVLDPNAGGVAKLATLIKQVRASNPNNLLLGVGDARQR